VGRTKAVTSLHEETLSPVLRQVLRSLGPCSTKHGFHLAGGTALAIRLGHRRSDDADWFREAPIDEPLILANAFRREVADFKVTATAPSTLHGIVGSVRCSWFGYPYPTLSDPTPVPSLGVALASLDDIAAMKLAAVAQRGSRKDFVDVHALCTHHRPLAELLSLYRRRYGIGDTGHVLIGLTYFDDADAEPAPRMLRPVPWSRVKRDLAGWVRDLWSAGLASGP